MSSQLYANARRKACVRCRHQKRKCDRAVPKCSLCQRLDTCCRYEAAAPPRSRSPVPQGPGPELISTAVPYALQKTKASILESLSGFQPGDVATIYLQNIGPWFPILSEARLHNRTTSTWDDTSVDFALLSVTVVLLGTTHKPTGEGKGLSSRSMSLYLSSKGWVAMLEGAGVSSVEFVQSRLFLTLFEVAHGLYPAAFVSIGAVARAADALLAYEDTLTSGSAAEEDRKEERMLAWWGILVVDRYIAIENGTWPPVTKGRTVPDLPLSISSSNSEASLFWVHSFSRLCEASNLLENVRTTVYEPTPQLSFNIDEVTLIFKTLNSFAKVLHNEIKEDTKIYASSLALCETGLLIACENGSKADPNNAETSICPGPSVATLRTLFKRMVNSFEHINEASIDFNLLSPFIVYPVYKATAIMNEWVRVGDESRESLLILKSLRDILRLLSQRWRAAERFLDLLNEDTTPRILKVLGSI